MNIRQAGIEDLERVVEIYNSSIEWRLSTADTSPVSVESRKDWLLSHTESRPLLLCVNSEHIYGWISIEGYKDRPAYKNTVELTIYVDHIHLGKGIGTQMLSNAVTLLPSLGVKSAIANIYSHNEASIRLFRNFGFKQWGELPEVCEMDGRNYSVSIFGLKIQQT